MSQLFTQAMAGNIATSTITATIYLSPEADPDGDGVPNQDDVKKRRNGEETRNGDSHHSRNGDKKREKRGQPPLFSK